MIAMRTIDLRYLTDAEFRHIVLQQLSFLCQIVEELRDASTSPRPDDAGQPSPDPDGVSGPSLIAATEEAGGDDDSPAITRTPHSLRQQ